MEYPNRPTPEQEAIADREMARFAREGWRVTVDAHGMVTRGDPRPQTLSPFVTRALEGKLPAKELAR
jgi:hypothetical protein